jgi:mRNA interferase MazF
MPKQRDIVLIPVPFTDLSSVKRRPVLVLSSDAHCQASPDMLVAAITSNLSGNMPGVVFNSTDMEIGALPRQSLIRADKLYTLSQANIIKPYGRLSQASFEDVLKALDAVLGR